MEQVKLADFLRSEKGLDTVLNEKGSNFSGGQCQRLVIARALLHDSPVYIFDEATSNIDVESENDIMQVIYEPTKSRTVILISHRLANVAGADNIYVLDQGAIAESGSHQALLATLSFSRSSEKLHTWFINTKLYKDNLEDYVAGRGITKRTKIRIMVTVTLLMSIGFIMMGGVPVGRIVLGCVWLFHIVYFIFCIKTIPAEQAEAAHNANDPRL